jgi:hypothetical protein
MTTLLSSASNKQMNKKKGKIAWVQKGWKVWEGLSQFLTGSKMKRTLISE